ncbi:MAG: PIN domain-containing protein [Nitrospirota bacterium]
MKLESKGVKPRDALHIACALEAGADYFLTCDDKLIRDYLKLQDKLFEGMNVEEIYKKAKEYSEKKQKVKKA